MSKPSLHELRRQKKLEIKDTVENGPFRADWKSLEEYSVPRWYEEAKFGIFIHWGCILYPPSGQSGMRAICTGKALRCMSII